jgi:hypothetical protein
MLGTYFAKFDEIVYMEMEVQFVCDMPVNFNWYKSQWCIPEWLNIVQTLELNAIDY